MSRDPKKRKPGNKPQSMVGFWIEIGTGVGVALGVALNNIASGIVVGVGAGLIFGIVLVQRNRD